MGSVSLERLREVVAEIGASGLWPHKATAVVDVDGDERFSRTMLEALLDGVDDDEFSWPDGIPEQDQDEPDFYLWADRAYATMAVLAQAVEVGETEVHEGDLELADAQLYEGDLEVNGSLSLIDSESVLWVTGDLRVEGDLELEQGVTLMVLGSVHIKGHWSDYAEWNVALVLGDVTVRGALVSSGELFIGRRLHAPLVDLSYNHGRTVVLGGVSAWLLVESDHGETRFLGEHEVQLVQLDEGVGLESTPIDMLLEALRNRLTMPGLDDGEHDDFVDEYEELEAILEELRAQVQSGEPVLRGPGEGPLYEDGPS
ncbi:MAG: hypothetical protein AAFS10_14675 [Myxococcota bacterium]